MIRLIFLRDVDLIDLAALPTFIRIRSADQLDYRLFFSYLPRPRYPLLVAQFRMTGQFFLVWARGLGLLNSIALFASNFKIGASHLWVALGRIIAVFGEKLLLIVWLMILESFSLLLKTI